MTGQYSLRPIDQLVVLPSPQQVSEPALGGTLQTGTYHGNQQGNACCHHDEQQEDATSRVPGRTPGIAVAGEV